MLRLYRVTPAVNGQARFPAPSLRYGSGDRRGPAAVHPSAAARSERPGEVRVMGERPHFEDEWAELKAE